MNHALDQCVISVTREVQNLLGNIDVVLVCARVLGVPLDSFAQVHDVDATVDDATASEAAPVLCTMECADTQQPEGKARLAMHRASCMC
ncbi:MAG: hypothetical protein GX481_03915 [Atopobium sp.]|nr:hypothetical protein [Atopobium sp.]